MRFRYIRKLHEAKRTSYTGPGYISLWRLLQRELSKLGTLKDRLNSLDRKSDYYPIERLEFKSKIDELSFIIQNNNGIFSNNRLDISVVHNDIWSGNIFVTKQTGAFQVVLLDYEWSRITTKLVDLARIYSRGLTVRNINKPYLLQPDG